MEADLNPKIVSLASRLVESNNPQTRRHHDDEDDEEAVFAELEAEIENDTNRFMREHALEVLKRDMEQVNDMKANEHGKYTEIMDEKQLIRVTANEPRCVVHFFHGNFKRCSIMDKHLANIAPKYFTTRFIRVFVENVPWLVEKLMVKVLPCVVCFIDGVTKDRIIGFEELGNNDTFETAALEIRLSMSGVIQKTTGMQTLYKISSGRMREQDDNDDEFDLDD